FLASRVSLRRPRYWRLFTMNYRRLGRSGLKVSELSFGSWVTYGNQLGESAARECMAAAFDAGVNFFDNAEVYAKGNAESIMGEALKHLGWRRSAYIVSTKFFWGLHDGPNELHKPVTEQPQYNLFHRERVEQEYARLYTDIGLGTTTWSPLASGLLTGKYDGGVPADSRAAVKGYEWLAERVQDGAKLAKVRALAPIAQELSCTLAQLAIAWCLKNPRVSTVITGASRPSQVTENMQAQQVVAQLSPDVMARIDAIANA